MKRVLIATLLLLAIPAATAQVPAGDITVNATAPAVFIDPNGAMSVTVDIAVGCAIVLTGGGNGTISLSAAVPAYIAVAADDILVSAADCVGNEYATKTGSLVLTPNATAPGLQLFNAKVTALFTTSAGSTSGESQVDGLAVDYRGGHTLSLAGDQTFEVVDGVATVMLDVTISANTKTMVMFLDQSTTAGSVSGLSHKVFDVLAGERNKTYTITFTAPEGAWTEEQFTFHNYSHCLDKEEGCDPLFINDPTWTFTNMGGNVTAGGSDGGKDSPGLAMPLVLGTVALIGFALRRRQ
jgi:hypothetical protein